MVSGEGRHLSHECVLRGLDHTMIRLEIPLEVTVSNPRMPQIPHNARHRTKPKPVLREEWAIGPSGHGLALGESPDVPGFKEGEVSGEVGGGVLCGLREGLGGRWEGERAG